MGLFRRRIPQIVDDSFKTGVFNVCLAPGTTHSAEIVEDPFGIEEFLECHHGIIGEADKGTSPVEAWTHLELEPFIQHVVQKNVREAR